MSPLTYYHLVSPDFKSDPDDLIEEIPDLLSIEDPSSIKDDIKLSTESFFNDVNSWLTAAEISVHGAEIEIHLFEKLPPNFIDEIEVQILVHMHLDLLGWS